MMPLSAWYRPAIGGALALALMIAATGTSTRAAATGDGEARAVVEGFHTTLLQAMKTAKTLGVKGRFALLAPEVARRFNLRKMIAIATGPSWPKASADERDRLTDAFGRFSAANYAASFESFSGQSFGTDSVAPGPSGTRLVTTRIDRPGDTPVRLVYVTQPSGGRWQIVDVLVDDGISQLAMRRSEYRSVLGNRGIEGLVTELDRMTDRLLAR
jgi:phospholipid transport system substrate-binding protein